MLLVPYVLASIFCLISNFITYFLHCFLLTFKILPYFHFRSSIVGFGCCSSYCKIPVPRLGWLQLAFTKTVGAWSHCLAAQTGMRCAHITLQSFSWRSNDIHMRDGARQLEHLHLPLMVVIKLFHAPLVSAVSSHSSSVWSQSKSSLTLLLHQKRMLFTYTEKVVIASLSSQLGEAMWDCFYCLAISLYHLAQLHYIQFFPLFPERRKQALQALNSHLNTTVWWLEIINELLNVMFCLYDVHSYLAFQLHVSLLNHAFFS